MADPLHHHAGEQPDYDQGYHLDNRMSGHGQGELISRQEMINVVMIGLRDYLARVADVPGGQEEIQSMGDVLDRLSGDQLESLFNITGTSSKLGLLHFLNNMTNEFGPMDQSLFPEYHMKTLLVLYVSPILLLLGTLGNLFSFITLRRKPLLKVSSYTYLAGLAVIDTVVLYNGLLRVWLKELTGFDYYSSGNWICKLSVVLGYVASDMSVWLIIAVTVERYIVVCFPFKAIHMCNTSRAKKVILFLAFIMFAINVHFLWTSELGKNGHQEACMAAPQFQELAEEIWPWVDAFIYSFCPFVVIITLNVLIVREVATARSNQMFLSASEQNVQDTETVGTRYADHVCRTDGSHPCKCQMKQGSGRSRGRQQESSKLTALLLTVSFTFLLFTLPNNISLIVTRFWNKRVAAHEDDAGHAVYQRLAHFTLARTITELLMYTNHSINFFLYCATGNKFRQQFFAVCRSSCTRIRFLFHSRPGAIQRGKNQTLHASKRTIIVDAECSSPGNGSIRKDLSIEFSTLPVRPSSSSLSGSTNLTVSRRLPGFSPTADENYTKKVQFKCGGKLLNLSVKNGGSSCNTTRHACESKAINNTQPSLKGSFSDTVTKTTLENRYFRAYKNENPSAGASTSPKDTVALVDDSYCNDEIDEDDTSRSDKSSFKKSQSATDNIFLPCPFPTKNGYTSMHSGACGDVNNCKVYTHLKSELEDETQL